MILQKSHLSRNTTYCNICVDLENFGHSLLKLVTKNKFVNSIKATIMQKLEFQCGVSKNITCSLLNSDYKELEMLSKTNHPVEKILSIIDKVAEKENSAWSPVNHFFLLPSFNMKPINPDRKYVADKDISSMILNGSFEFLNAFGPLPKYLCLNATKIQLNKKFKQQIKFAEGSNLITYELYLIVTEKNYDVEFIQEDRIKKNSFVSDNSSILVDSSFIDPCSKIRYLFYKKCIEIPQLETLKQMINTFWMNLFLIDNMFLSAMKIRSSILFLKFIKNHFIKLEKFRNNIKENLKIDDSGILQKNYIKDNHIFIRDSDFNAITEIFLQKIDIFSNTESLDYFTIFEKILEEIHFLKNSNCEICSCLVCECLHRFKSLPMYYNQIINLDLDPFSNYSDFFSKAKTIFPSQFFSDVKNDKPINPKAFINYMHIRLYLDSEFKKIQTYYSKYMIFKTNGLPFNIIDAANGLNQLEFLDEKNNYVYYELKSIVYESTSQKTLITIVNSENTWHKTDPNHFQSSKSLFSLLPASFCKMKIILIYEKTHNLISKSTFNQKVVAQKHQIRCDVNDDLSLWFINISIQSLLNLRSFKNGMASFSIENTTNNDSIKSIRWVTELVNIFKAELRQNNQIGNIQVLSMFRKYFIEDQKYNSFFDKGYGKTTDFFDYLLNCIHKFRCEKENLCPACDNFLTINTFLMFLLRRNIKINKINKIINLSYNHYDI